MSPIEWTADSAAPGYLWVLSDPGTEATVEEFQDWYDNEHVPLRMNHIPQFLTGARYSATDGLYPHWSAAYDIASVGLFSNPIYTHLRANRSPREANLVGRLGVLDRRTAQTIATSAPAPKAEDAAKFVLTISDDKEVPVKGFEGVARWKRSHGHRVYDSLVTGHAEEPVANKHLPFVAVHEFDSEEYVNSAEFQAATEGRKEVRRWQLYRAYPNTAPKENANQPDVAK